MPQLLDSVQKATQKVLVRSRYREVFAATHVEKLIIPDNNGNPRVDRRLYGRQFKEAHAYMTVQEAQFLVESDQNRSADDAGQPNYWYPAGQPVLRDVEYFSNKKERDLHGSFVPPSLVGAGNGVDARAAKAASDRADEDKQLLEAWTAKNGVDSPVAHVAQSPVPQGDTQNSPPVKLTSKDAEAIGLGTVPNDGEGNGKAE